MIANDIGTAHSKLPMPGSVLAGRTVECASLERVLQRARARNSGVLVLRGEPGIGKTALLDRTAVHAEGFRIVRFRGVESEMELPYAGLQLLCSAMCDGLARLQPSQRQALDAAFGLGVGQPDRLQLGLATLALLTDASARQPLLCIIDDAQWLDRRSAQVVAFVVRRLETQPIAVLLAERDPQTVRELDGLPSLRLLRLSHADARRLFGSVIRGRVDESVIGRMITETRGNPQALLDVLNGVSSADFAGGFGVNTTAGLSRELLEESMNRIQRLPSDSRRLLLLAAADPTGDPALQWRAAAELAIPPKAAAPLESDGLLQLSPRVTFHDPQLRSATYGLASTEDRREVHSALAAATDAVSAPDRRAWHLAQAAQGPDEQLAVELERYAPRAHQRGGPAAAAAFLEQAALVTLNSARRSERALAAAAAKLAAGAPDAALRLLATAELGPLDPPRHGHHAQLRAQVAFASRRGDDASHLLLEAARQLEPLDPAVARETYLEALVAAIFAGRLDRSHSMAAVANAVPAGLPAQPQAVDLLLDGLVVRFTRGYPAACRGFRKALGALAQSGRGDKAGRWLWLGYSVAADLWDDEAWHTLTTVELPPAEDAGMLTVLPYVLTYRAIADLHCGEFDTASALADEADAISAATGSPPLAYTSLVIAGWRGQEQRALALFAAARRDARDRGEGITVTTASFAEAVLYNGLGRYQAALAAAQDAVQLDELGLFGWSLVELIEAAARSGRPDAAAAALEALSERARVSGTDWALGIEARSRALLSEGGAGEDLYLEAIERLERSRIKVHLARARLVYGEWLRRQGRRIDARAQLRAARESFVAMGADAFAERAHREHLATGEKVRRRLVGTCGQLTPQEARIAFLARDGLTNPKIGERLFVSPRTVEYHLHKVFEKLGITSRRELHGVLDNAVSLATALPPAATHGRPPQISRRSKVA